MARKGCKHDPTADSSHPWYPAYRYHKQNPMCPWESFRDFVYWAEENRYSPADGDRVTLRVLRREGFAPRIKRVREPDPIVTEPKEDYTVIQELAKVWCDMRSRCDDKSHSLYAYVGGKGIGYATGWSIFEVFRKWAEEQGYQKGQTLMRYNRNLDFGPTNCCFA